MRAGAPATARLEAVIDGLDRRLGEVGRRDHRFAWLRDEGGELVSIAAYYPGRRLLVLGDSSMNTDEFREAAAGRGLTLVVVADDATGDDADRVSEEIAASAPARAVRSTAETREASRAAALPTRDAADSASGASASDRTAEHAHGSEREGFSLGLLLLVVVALEGYLGFVLIGIHAGDLVLGFGFMLDSGARVAGMAAAAADGEPDRAWGRVLGGSPALWGMSDEEAARSRAATVSRTIAWLAGGVIALGIVVAIL